MATLTIWVGIGGVAIVLVAYALLATGRITANSMRYQLFNIIGTAGILVSFLGQWNLAAFLANVAWILIGIAALIRDRIVKGNTR